MSRIFGFADGWTESISSPWLLMDLAFPTGYANAASFYIQILVRRYFLLSMLPFRVCNSLRYLKRNKRNEVQFVM